MDWGTGLLGIGSLLGGGAALYGALQSRDALENSQALQGQSLAQNSRITEAMLAPVTTATGSKTAYGGPDVGWSTQLSPTDQRIQAASDAEQLAQLSTDAGMRRDTQQANALRRQREGAIADPILTALQDRSQYDPEYFTSRMKEQAVRGLKEQFADSRNDFNRQIVRGGSTASADLQNKAARAEAEAISNAILSAELQGPATAEALRAQSLGTDSNLYNLLATRASGFDTAQPTATDINNNLAAALQNQAANAGGVGAKNAVTTAQLAALGPQNATANLYGGAAMNNALTNIFGGGAGMYTAATAPRTLGTQATNSNPLYLPTFSLGI